MAALLMSQRATSISRCLLTPLSSKILHRFSSSKSYESVSASVSSESTDITVSESCTTRLRQLGPKTTLRIGVDGGGCSGFQYSFELDTPIEEGDRVFTKDGVSVIVDETSLQYLKGATIEYHKELIRSAFRVVNNPLAEQGCSCGASFNIKLPSDK